MASKCKQTLTNEPSVQVSYSNSSLSLGSVVSVMRKRTSVEAILFRKLAVSDCLRDPAVQVYYIGQWLDFIEL